MTLGKGAELKYMPRLPGPIVATSPLHGSSHIFLMIYGASSMAGHVPGTVSRKSGYGGAAQGSLGF